MIGALSLLNKLTWSRPPSRSCLVQASVLCGCEEQSLSAVLESRYLETDEGITFLYLNPFDSRGLQFHESELAAGILNLYHDLSFVGDFANSMYI